MNVEAIKILVRMCAVSESININAVYAVFTLATIFSFPRVPIQRASAIFYCGGWLFLPVAAYPLETLTADYFTVNVIGAALPSNLGITKALIVPIAILFRIIMNDWTTIKQLHLKPIDGMMLAFCILPLPTMLINQSSLASACYASLYLLGSWGGTWLIGRICFSDSGGRSELLAGIRWCGVALLPIAFTEGVAGPFLYKIIYGEHAFLLEGSERYFGFRPLGFFEHGNQYGIWIAASAFAWYAFNKYSALTTIYSRMWLILTITASVISQSVGAILLLIFGIAILNIPARLFRPIAISGIATVVLFGSIYLSGIVPIEKIARNTVVGQQALSFLKDTGRMSLAYRIRRDQMSLDLLHEQPIVGYGKWDWWRPLGSHPWGLPLLIAGQFGIAAFLLSYLTLIWTPILAITRRKVTELPFAVIAVMAVIDSALNSFIFFPAILIAGCLVRSRAKNKLV